MWWTRKCCGTIDHDMCVGTALSFTFRDHGQPQVTSEPVVFLPRFEPGTSQIQTRHVTTRAIMLTGAVIEILVLRYRDSWRNDEFVLAMYLFLYMFSCSKFYVLFVRLASPCMPFGNKMSSPAPLSAPWSLTELQYQEGKPHCLRNILNTCWTWLCAACQYNINVWN